MEEHKELLIYENPLAEESDIRGFVMEGQAYISFQNGSMVMESALDPALGQKANFVMWCPEDFPDNIRVEWEFKPLTDRGLCILFFAAAGKNGCDLFDPSLSERTGEYPQYHSGDINAFHVSYFRRKEPDERALHTCNLRKSYGFHLVAQGADPIPDAVDATDFYRLKVIKNGNQVAFFVNDLQVFCYYDDGMTYGPILGKGKIGFRQLAPLAAEYSNLKVYKIV